MELTFLLVVFESGGYVIIFQYSCGLTLLEEERRLICLSHLQPSQLNKGVDIMAARLDRKGNGYVTTPFHIPLCRSSLHKFRTYPLLRGAAPLSLPVAAPPDIAAASAPGAGLGVAPAIQPARSKFPGVPPPDIALRVAPEMGEERDCFSNSARISGSTEINHLLAKTIYI